MLVYVHPALCVCMGQSALCVCVCVFVNECAAVCAWLRHLNLTCVLSLDRTFVDEESAALAKLDGGDATTFVPMVCGRRARGTPGSRLPSLRAPAFAEGQRGARG
jgi:hypothetical protein